MYTSIRLIVLPFPEITEARVHYNMFEKIEVVDCYESNIEFTFNMKTWPSRKLAVILASTDLKFT